MTVKPIVGQPSSAEVRARLAAEGRPVLLAFSGGKDAVATWLALKDAGVEVLPYYLYYVPGLKFIEQEMARYERILGQRIYRLPHEAVYRWLDAAVFQAPERLAVLAAAQLPTPSYADLVAMVREELGVAADTWVADGVRAADSIVRRTSFSTHGVMKPKGRKVSPIWDWTKAEVLARIARAGIELPVDYEWFGRSFDGIDARFLGPLREHAPDDYARVLEWFPLAELGLLRGDPDTSATSTSSYRSRRAAEDARRARATDSEFWIAACFQTSSERDEFAHLVGADRFASGALLQDLLDRSARPGKAPLPFGGGSAKRPRPRRTARPKLVLPDPLGDVVYSGVLVTDVDAEFHALLAAFRESADRSGPFADVIDSPHWLAFHWPTRADKDAFLAKLPGATIGGLGNKYVDGAELCRRLTMKEL